MSQLSWSVFTPGKPSRRHHHPVEAFAVNKVSQIDEASLMIPYQYTDDSVCFRDESESASNLAWISLCLPAIFPVSMDESPDISHYNEYFDQVYFNSISLV